MTPELIGTLAVGIAILGFLWNLHRELRRDVADIRHDVADLRERMARLEGLFEGFTRQPQGESPA